MRLHVLAICFLLASIRLLADAPAVVQPLPFISGQAFHILPQTHNHEFGSFSLCEGLDGRLYVGTAKYGMDSFLVELDPNTGKQRVVIDTNKIGSYAGKGYAAQAMIHTRNFVAPSGRVYVGSRQGDADKDDNPWTYPGGFLMSYDPRVDAAQSYGMVPYRGYGVIDIVADESRGLIYYICGADSSRDYLWGVYDTKKKAHRLLGPHACPSGNTLLDAKGRAYVMTADYKLACYDPSYDQVTVRDILLNGKSFSADPSETTTNGPVRTVPVESKPFDRWEYVNTSWVMAPDGQSAYLLMPFNSTLYSITLSGAGKSTTATDLGKMLTTDKPVSSCSSLVMHPDGNVYALFATPDPAGKAKGNLNMLARYEPKAKTMHTLGALAIRNKDYFNFKPQADGTPKPWSDGVETVDGTLVPTAAHQGMIAGRDGTLYAMLTSPFSVLKVDDYRVPAAPPTPAQIWLTSALGQCDRIQKNMPEITKVAEAVAQRYLAGGRLDCILNSNNGWPGQGPQSEITGRSGGIMDLGCHYVPDPVDTVRPAADQANDVIIIGWQRAPTPGDEKRLKIYRDRGAKILGFGPRGLPELVECEKLCDYWIDTGFGADDHAITLEDGRKVGHGNTLVNMLDAWTFVAEFVGALTRQGKMPPMWKAMLYANDWEPWYNKYGGKYRFHEDLFVPPLARSELGNRYLDQMRWHFRKFENTQLDQVRKAAQLILDEHARGKKTIVTIAGHCMYESVGKYEDAEWANGIGFHGWVPYETRNYLSRTTRDALVLVLAYCGFPREQWATFVGAGQNRLLLVTSEINEQEYKGLDAEKDECQAIIDMGHAFGDACTRIEGYPFPVFPPSGIMQDIAYEAIDVEVMAKIGKEQPK